MPVIRLPSSRFATRLACGRYDGMFLGACEGGQIMLGRHSIADVLVHEFKKARTRKGPDYGWQEFLAEEAPALDGFDPELQEITGESERNFPINYVVKGARYLR